MKPISIIKKLNEDSIKAKNAENNKHIKYCKRLVNSLCEKFGAKAEYKESIKFKDRFGYQNTLEIKISLPDKELNYTLLLPTWVRQYVAHPKGSIICTGADLRKDGKEIKGFNEYDYDAGFDIRGVIDYLLGVIENDLSNNK